MSFEQEVVKKILKDIDFSIYEKQINAAIKEFFNSDYFYDSFAEAIGDEGIGYSLGEKIGKQVRSQLAKVKINITV